MPVIALLLAAVVAQAGPSTVPAQDEVLKTLRAGHPRLIAVPADLDRVKKAIAEDPRAAAIYKEVKKDADKLLRQKDTVEHVLVGPRLLGESRKCVDRVYTLATVYRIDGDRRYADRAIREMLAAAAFDDWNPRHFLDTAEMTHALAIGYDWLYDVLTKEQRETIRRAIVELGLREAEKVYRGGGWWAKSQHNWNQVCNGGITIGALAVADEEPELAAWTICKALESVPRAMAEFAPDGAWGEGPGYWNYATRYNVYMIAGLESALGSDFGLCKFPGFSVTGDFRMHMVGPTGEAFNFADGGSRAGTAAQMFWFARKFDQPVYAWHERELIGGKTPLHLWWFDPRGGPPTDFAASRHFRHADVVMMRSRWYDPRAIYVGFKGGDNKVNHSHLELGTFVLEADGVRWAVDLGSDNYNLPGYFGSKRWTYYRLSTEGQNTLWFDKSNQDPKAVAPIVEFEAEGDSARAVADLSAAYAKFAGKVRREIALVDGKRVRLRDEIQGAAGHQVIWQMHTRAKIELAGNRAVLRQGGEQLTAEILSPVGATFATMPASPPPPQKQQPDVTRLVVPIDVGQRPVRLTIEFTPGGRK